jgi:hypothetical protein
MDMAFNQAGTLILIQAANTLNHQHQGIGLITIVFAG